MHSRSRLRANCRRRRFALLELLVVVAIIAILAALLLPVLGRARKEARRVVCLSQMRQMGIVALSYGDENDDWFPYRDTNHFVDLYCIGAPPTDEDHRADWLGHLPEYTLTSAPAIAYCPVGTPSAPSPRTYWPVSYPPADYYCFSYCCSANANTIQSGGAWLLPSQRVSKATGNPALTLWADIARNRLASMGDWVKTHGDAYGGSPLPPEGLNAVHVDGSGRWVRYAADTFEACFSYGGVCASTFYWEKP